MISLANIVLLCPKNDEESVLILQIAKKAGIPTVVSPQAHGSRLEKEENLIERLKKANPEMSTVVIVEIPGPEEEKRLEAGGLRLEIIDHHRYEGLDRMKPISSLEQFLQLFEIDDVKLTELGFDPFLVKGIGLMDRGWVWELDREGISKPDQKRIREYYLQLLGELGGLRQTAVDEAKRAWENREERDGVFIIRSMRSDLRIREPFSMLIADLFAVPPPALIIEGNERISLQDVPVEIVKRLHTKFGGYTFGKDTCWGFAPGSTDHPVPTVEEILAVVNGVE